MDTSELCCITAGPTRHFFQKQDTIFNNVVFEGSLYTKFILYFIKYTI